MNDSKVRAIISITIIGTFMVVTGYISCYIFAYDFTHLNNDPLHKTIDALKDYSSIFTGIIGTIIGFYFGKSHDSTNVESKHIIAHPSVKDDISKTE